MKNFSKNWFFIWLKEWYLTQRLEIYVFETWFKELDFFFWWLADLKLFFFQKLWRKELHLFCMTQRIEFFLYDAKNWTFFFWFAVKNWAFFFFLNFDSNWAFFKIGLKELNYFYIIYRIEPLLFSQVWFEELNLVLKKETQKIEIFFVDTWLTELNSL